MSDGYFVNQAGARVAITIIGVWNVLERIRVEIECLNDARPELRREAFLGRPILAHVVRYHLLDDLALLVNSALDERPRVTRK